MNVLHVRQRRNRKRRAARLHRRKLNSIEEALNPSWRTRTFISDKFATLSKDLERTTSQAYSDAYRITQAVGLSPKQTTFSMSQQDWDDVRKGY